MDTAGLMALMGSHGPFPQPDFASAAGGMGGAPPAQSPLGALLGDERLPFLMQMMGGDGQGQKRQAPPAPSQPLYNPAAIQMAIQMMQSHATPRGPGNVPSF